MSQRVRQEIFSSLPAIDGRGEIRDWSGKPLETPWTQAQRDKFLKYELFPNTLEAIKCGLLLPVTETHHDASPYLKGRVTGLHLAHRTTFGLPHYVAVAEMEVDDELAAVLDEGKLPGCSCEFVPYGDLTGLGGGKIGAYFTAVTYNGSAPVAQPQLQRLDADLNELGVIPFYAFTLVDKPRTFALPSDYETKPQPKGKLAMTPEEKGALMEEIKALIKDTCAAMLGETDMKAKAEADPVDKAESKTDMAAAKLGANIPDKEPDASDSAIAAMAAEFKAMKEREMKAEFATMGLDSKLEADFIKQASTFGLDPAKALFSQLKPVSTDTTKPKPPARSQMIATQPGTGTGAPADQARKFAAMRTQGYSDAQIKAILAKQQELAKGMVTA